MKANAESTTHSRPVTAETHSDHHQEEQQELFIPPVRKVAPYVATKLTVGESKDPLEQEADTIAAQVTASPPTTGTGTGSHAEMTPSVGPSSEDQLNRSPEEEAIGVGESPSMLAAPNAVAAPAGEGAP
ncbi:MAG: hypothetical protein AAF828_00790, partial [Bacteroidota bacterium]